MGMKGFKGFEKDFSCRGKQYEENTTYEEHGVGCCHKGVMHFCEDPWEVLNPGNSAQIGSSGDSAKIGSSGNSAQIGSSGYYAQIGSSGNSAQIGSSGDSAQINSTGEDAVIMCAGSRSKAKGKKGSWITLAEWVKDEEKGRYVPVCVKTERVDGEKIKEDTYYTLKNGEFVEVQE